MKLKDKDLALILIVLGVAFVLLPKISSFLPNHPAESGRLVGGESGGGYFPSTGFDIPWNLLQQTPDTGYVGMDPPIDDEDPIELFGWDVSDPAPPDEDGSFWDAVRDGLGFGAAVEIVRRTVRDIDGLKKEPPSGGTPAPAPVEQPAPAPVGIKLPEFDPAYAKDAAALGGAAGLTALLAKLTGAGSTLAARTPTTAGGMLFTPEMFGAPAGTTKRNVGMYFDQLKSGAYQISQGRVVQGVSTALIGPSTPKQKSSSSSSRPKHHGGKNVINTQKRPHPHSTQLSTRTQRISKVDYS